ncbi:MAG: dihydrolipoyllysine-residue succinyltransferase [Actinomycetota bacterium]|jgi:pyruvate dehydrogenase E2 component (dihydrolipoamide acetyltransferase)
MSFKHTVVMPKMSMTMETGELIGFHVAEGQEVKAGDVLFEVMTDKIDMEVEAPADGKIEKIVAAPGAVLEIGKPVLIMETETQVLSFDFDAPESEVTPETAEITPVVSNPDPVAVTPVTQVVAPTFIVNENPKSVPAARKLATDKGINLQTIRPTGPFETITYEDVLNSNVDPAIAQRRQANKALIAKGIEMTLAVPQVSFTRAINKSAGSEAKWHAILVTKWAKTLRTFGQDDIGVALIIESKYGSALPVFKNPDQIDLATLTELVRTTTEQAKSGKVPLAMLNGATTTIFDLTSYAMASNRPSLFPNQATGLTVGIDSVGALSISLTIDLRALDFYDGAVLLERMVNEL